MVVPFGVSVGDFVSTLGLIRKIAAALAESHGSGAQFRKLEATLGCLERAVKRVLDTDAGEDDEFVARWKETTEHLDVLVKDFHKKIAKYEPSLRLGGSSSKWKDAMRKIHFTTIKDDIAEFETQLLVQMGTLQLLLEEEKSSALARMEHRMQRIETKVDETQNSQVLLKTAATQIFGLLQGILGMLLASGGTFAMSIPRQICFSGHLTFQDAWGDYFPLHIEMVGCWEMLYGVLQIKLRDKPGAEAVRAKNFKLQDGSVAGKWSDVDVDKPYDQVFQSGGRWDMAMIFPRDRQTEGGCPKCGRAEDPGADPSKIECRNPACRLCYSRVTDVFSEVHVLPEHYEMPSMMNAPDPGPETVDMVPNDKPPANVLAVDATGSSQSLSSQQADSTPDADDDGEAPEPVAITTWQGQVRLEDLANVYLARPPVVFLRSPKQVWHMVPWRLFRTLQGLRFFAEYVCKLSVANVHLRDWHTGHVIDGSNWSSVDEGVYYGMAVELICSERGQEQGAAGSSGSSRCPTGLSCHLCGKTFFSQVTLGRHTATHLRDKPCPGTCTICGVI